MIDLVDSPRARRAWIAAAVLAAALPYALKVVADHDLWWHVKTGELILEQRALPATDPFSFTAEGAPWTNHEWLSDVLVAVVYSFGGDRAMSLVRIGLLLGVVGSLAVLLWRRLPHPLFVLAGVLLATPLLRIFVNFRPHSYTYLFALLLLLVLHASERRPRALWIIPPLIVLWTNLHGGFLFGLGLLGVAFTSRWLGLEEPRSRLEVADRRRMVAVFALSLIAPMVNPYGLGLFSYLRRELGANHSLILEWRSIWHFPEYHVPFVLLVAVPLVAVLLARRLRPAMPIALLGLSAVGTFLHGRFLILLVIFSSLVTFSAASAMLERTRLLERAGLLTRLGTARWAWALCALPLLAGLLQFSVDLKRKGLRLEVDGRRVPIEACEFLSRYDLGPNLLVRFDWGGYAIWHLYPDYKVSADGRNLTVYEAGFVDRLIRSYHAGRFTENAERFEVDVILSENAGPAYRELRSDTRWARIHEDRVAAVFVPTEALGSLGERRTPAPGIQPASERFFFP